MSELLVWLQDLGDTVLALAGTPWILVALFALTVIDGFFPPVPSESVVIALASLSMADAGPPLWAILPVAAAGAFVGDTIAYHIGKRVPLRTMRLFRTRRGARTLAWAERMLRYRGGAFILSARYIPIGRVAVNMSAGALGFPRRRFLGFAGIAAVMWAIYSTLLGIGAGAFLHQYPWLGVLVGVVLGVLIGTLVDAVIRKFFGSPDHFADTEADVAGGSDAADEPDGAPAPVPTPDDDPDTGRDVGRPAQVR